MPQPTPLIAVAADVKLVDGYRWHAAADTYLKAVALGLHGVPLILPSLVDLIDLDTVIDRVDGVLLPGSRSNVHPSRYGETASPKSEPYDPERDALTLPLIRTTIARGVPLFAICRGMQELNVALGGTLVSELQEVAGRDDHRAPASERQDERFAIRQEVHLDPAGALAAILDARSVQVNSLHRQGIGRLGENLAVEATAPDGTVEAVRVVGARGFAMGVQWHPEYWIQSDQPSARIFAAFGKAVRAHMAAKEAGAREAAE